MQARGKGGFKMSPRCMFYGLSGAVLNSYVNLFMFSQDAGKACFHIIGGNTQQYHHLYKLGKLFFKKMIAGSLANAGMNPPIVPGQNFRRGCVLRLPALWA